jgi:hypothetical protein
MHQFFGRARASKTDLYLKKLCELPNLFNQKYIFYEFLKARGVIFINILYKIKLGYFLFSIGNLGGRDQSKNQS